ncbi:MAG: hypothetical protein J6M17_09910 [Ruminococcus sp.]|nr:hypothetical protein [Ruminococcus sp.]
MKRTECHPGRRCCGLWLMLVGAVTAAAAAFGGRFYIHPVIFLAGFWVCFYIGNVSRTVRRRFSDGKMSNKQLKTVFLSMGVMFLVMSVIAGPFIGRQDWRMVWLGVFTATGVHFLMLKNVHGIAIAVLGTICCAISAAGYVFPAISMNFIAFSDSAAKIIFGAYMLFIAPRERFETAV